LEPVRLVGGLEQRAQVNVAAGCRIPTTHAHYGSGAAVPRRTKTNATSSTVATHRNDPHTERVPNLTAPAYVPWTAPTAAGRGAATVRLPGAKSMTARALVLGALSLGASTLRAPL